MEKRILAVELGGEFFRAARRECRKQGFFLRLVADMAETVEELMGESGFVLVALTGSVDIMEAVRIIRSLTDAPILILREEYDGEEKIALIEAGADEYIRCPDTTGEWVASAHALIRRYIGLKQDGGVGELREVCEGVQISTDRRIVYVNSREIIFPRREFEVFALLASSPGQVFTNEHLYREVWGDDYDYVSDNGLNSCLRRIRERLATVPVLDLPCRIRKCCSFSHSCLSFPQKLSIVALSRQLPFRLMLIRNHPDIFNHCASFAGYLLVFRTSFFSSRSRMRFLRARILPCDLGCRYPGLDTS